MNIKKLTLFFFVLMAISCNNTSNTNLASKANNKGVMQVSFITTLNNGIPKRYYNAAILPYLKNMSLLLKFGNVKFYNWENNNSCNVGLMAQISLNKTSGEVAGELKCLTDYNKYVDSNKTIKDKGAWTNMTNYYCGITGKPVNNIIGDLQKRGFNSLDICGLEYLSDNYILAHTDIETDGQYYADVNNLIKYLDTWILIIENQRQ